MQREKDNTNRTANVGRRWSSAGGVRGSRTEGKGPHPFPMIDRWARRPRPGTGRGLRVSGALWCALIAAGCTSADDPPHQRDANAAQVMQLCTQCHGSDLQGKSEILAPAIAGLPSWYVETQLHKFKEGLRGTHFDDVAGMRMRPMAMSLTEGDVQIIAQHVASMPVQRSHGEIGGDPDKGKTLYAPCVACHGPDAQGNQQLNAPPLAQANTWYVVAQLKKFKEGVRGTRPEDTTGGQMVPMAQGLPDEQAMRDVAAYIDTL